LQSWQRHPSLLRLVTALLAASLAIPAAASAWTWPVSGPVLRGFLFSEDNPLAPGQHRGIDIQGELGNTVVAPIQGTVTFVGRVAANGLTVTIQTTDGYTVTLLHLGSALVGRGDVVAEGQPVAIVGTSGVPEYSEPYVQLGVRLTSDPEGYLDPQAFLPPLAPPSVPPAPAPDPQPAPALPPVPAAPPPAAAPPADRVAPRAAGPVPGAPDRPVGEQEARRLATPGWQHLGATADSTAQGARAKTVASTGTAASLSLHPFDANASRAAAASEPPRFASSPAAALAPSWVRPRDPVSHPVAAGELNGRHGSAAASRELLLLFGLAAAVSLCAYEFRRRAARIIDGDALLPDNADLLCELEPAHRARVHDDRRGRTRPAPQAAR
jgi:hypothetical protein